VNVFLHGMKTGDELKYDGSPHPMHSGVQLST